MADKKNNIKSMIELIISSIDEFNSEFVTYKAKSIKSLLEDTLEYIKEKEQALNRIEDVADDYNRVEKTSQYYRDGFDEIQDIINKIRK